MYWGQVRGASLEFGLTEAHQTMVLNRVCGCVSFETDEQSHVGRDVLIAALLVAKRFGFETGPLIAHGKKV